jgi:hypothetical protein
VRSTTPAGRLAQSLEVINAGEKSVSQTAVLPTCSTDCRAQVAARHPRLQRCGWAAGSGIVHLDSFWRERLAEGEAGTLV